MAFKTAEKTKVTYAKLDIADRSSVENLARSVKEEHGVVDVLINNAGVNVDDEYSAENVRVTLDTNVRGTLLVRMGSLVFEFGSSLNWGLLSANIGQVIPPWFQLFPLSHLCLASHGINLELCSNLFLLLMLHKD